VTWLSDTVVGHLREVATWPELPSDRYTLRRPLGRGGMGTVYAARDALLGRDVAIKVSNAPVPDSHLEGRLRQEARVLARLEHPGIVPVHDAGRLDDGRLYYVMKLISGRTLTDLEPELDHEAAVLLVFERVAEAVAFAHAAGIVHRDIKPSNIMVGQFGEVLVLDWGIAKIATGGLAGGAEGSGRGAGGFAGGAEGFGGSAGEFGRGTGAATGAGVRVGTPGFMAPEQARGDAAAVTAAADVHALGALLFWMLVGRAPGDTDDVAVGLKNAKWAVPKRLRAIVVKCLQPDPARRYRDAAEVGGDLACYRAGQAVSAHRETILDRAERWFTTYRTAILLVAAYLVMRTAFALSQR
jgi:serine/threonine protein kinase